MQVIEVPKIFPDRVPQRFVERRPPQTAEQLVEVPTIISYSSLQRAVEQTIDIPVPQARRRGRGGLQGFRAGQGTPAADVEQIVEIPVPQRRRRRSGGLQSSLPGQGSTAYLEQIVDILAREGLQGFLPGWRSWRSSAYGWMNSAAGGPDLGSSRGGGSCTTPLMARSGGTNRAKTLLPFGVQRRWQDGGQRPCGAGRRCGCCPALGQVAVSWRQNGKEGGLTLSGGVGAHHTGDELN